MTSLAATQARDTGSSSNATCRRLTGARPDPQGSRSSGRGHTERRLHRCLGAVHGGSAGFTGQRCLLARIGTRGKVGRRRGCQPRDADGRSPTLCRSDRSISETTPDRLKRTRRTAPTVGADPRDIGTSVRVSAWPTCHKEYVSTPVASGCRFSRSLRPRISQGTRSL